MSDKQDLVAGIIDFLKTSIADGTVDADSKDSIEVAIDCLADVYDVDPETSSSKFTTESLLQILANYRAGKSAAKPAAAAKHEPNPAAEKLKADGNKALAQKDFQTAIDAYTKAIALDGSNAIYYSNRAAAYSSNSQPNEAVVDAKKAIEIEPTYSRAYSRLGLALYSLGDWEGSMKAYQQGLDVEGDNKTDGMKRGFEAAKKRYDEHLEESAPTSRSVDEAGASAGADGAGASAGGMPDLSSLLGGLGGGGLAEMMNNPMIQSAAQKLMSNPSALSEMMNNPAIANMRDKMSKGGTPDFASMMNDPAIQEMAKSFGMGSGGSK